MRIESRTIAILDEKIEGVVIAAVGKLVVRGRQFLKALSRNRREVAGELSVLGQDHCAPGHKAVYERFLTHFLALSQLALSLGGVEIRKEEDGSRQIVGSGWFCFFTVK